MDNIPYIIYKKKIYTYICMHPTHTFNTSYIKDMHAHAHTLYTHTHTHTHTHAHTHTHTIASDLK